MENYDFHEIDYSFLKGKKKRFVNLSYWNKDLEKEGFIIKDNAGVYTYNREKDNVQFKVLLWNYEWELYEKNSIYKGKTLKILAYFLLEHYNINSGNIKESIIEWKKSNLSKHKNRIN